MLIMYRTGKEIEISGSDFCSYNLQDREFEFKVWNGSLGKNETKWIMTSRIARILISAEPCRRASSLINGKAP
jgi:hypothetical protein